MNTNKLVSDICNLELVIKNPSQTNCNINSCLICENSTSCQVCNNDIKGIIKDNNKKSEYYGKCICNQEKGFQINPDTKLKMCICKDNYSFYKDTDFCKPNQELAIGKYLKGIEPKSGIKIYDDCYITCKKCSKEGTPEEQNCLECIQDYKKVGVNCIKNSITIDEDSDETRPPNVFGSPEEPSNDDKTDITGISGTDKLINDRNNTCLYNKSIWFKLGHDSKYIFYYVKIDECILIFHGRELFFVSNKSVCSNLTENGYTNQDIALCLNQSNSENFTYKDYINNEKVKEYNQSEKHITIDKSVEEGTIYTNFYFHLMTQNVTDINISSIHFDENDNVKNDFLLFKVDMKRKDTISTQVEYQFYNPNPSLIYEKVDINEYLKNKSKRRLQNGINNNDNYIYIDLPVRWNEDKLAKIDELVNNGIDPFNSSSEFYLDVCYTYTTPDNNDIYLQNRRDEYYPHEAFCEDNCEFVKYIQETKRIRCKCSPKNSTENYEKISFNFKEVNEKFSKKITSPNLSVMGCFGYYKNLHKNVGFYITLIFLISFFIITLI